MRYIILILIITVGCQLPRMKTNDEEIQTILGEMRGLTTDYPVETDWKEDADYEDELPELNGYTLIVDCVVRQKQTMNSENLGVIKMGTRIYGQPIGDWVLINYKKQDMAYLHKKCLK